MLNTKPRNSPKIGKSSVQKWGIKGKSDYPCRPLAQMKFQQLLELQTSSKTLKTTPKGLSSKKRCDGECLCANLSLNTHTRERDRDRIDTTLTLELKPSGNGVSKISLTLTKREEALFYRASCLVSLQASQGGDPSIHVYGGE